MYSTTTNDSQQTNFSAVELKTSQNSNSSTTTTAAASTSTSTSTQEMKKVSADKETSSPKTQESKTPPQNPPDDFSDDFSPGRLTRLQTMFSEIDTDRSGVIDSDELWRYFTRIGITSTQEEIRYLIKSIDIDENGVLDFGEFVELMTVKRLKKVFDDIDEDGSGTLEVSELRLAFDKLGIKLNSHQVQQILNVVDANADGMIDFQEFTSFFEHIPHADLRKIATVWCGCISVDIGSDLSPAQPLPNAKIFMAGAFSGVVSRTVIAPLTLLNIKSQTSATGSTWSFFRDITRKHGVKGLYKGNMFTCLRVVPFGGTVGIVYRNIVKMLPDTAEKWDPAKRLFAGAMAGMIATIPCYPLDLMRARLAVSEENSWRTVARHVYSKRGALGFYKGLTPTLQAVIPFIAIQQTTYDVLKRKSPSFGLEPSFGLFFGFGVIAGLCAQSAVHPLDLIRRRAQVDDSGEKKKTSFQAAKEIVQKRGTRGLFRGLGTACLKIIPAVSIGLVVRDYTLDHLEKHF